MQVWADLWLDRAFIVKFGERSIAQPNINKHENHVIGIMQHTTSHGPCTCHVKLGPNGNRTCTWVPWLPMESMCTSAVLWVHVDSNCAHGFQEHPLIPWVTLEPKVIHGTNCLPWNPCIQWVHMESIAHVYSICTHVLLRSTWGH